MSIHFSAELPKSCSICKHVDESRDCFNRVCWYCGNDKEAFALDEKKLVDEVTLGLVSKMTAKRIIEESKKDEGIPGQLRLTEDVL